MIQVWNCVSGGTCSHKNIYMPECTHKSHQCMFACVHLLGCLKSYEAFILMPPMASVGTGQYLVDGTHGAVVVPSKWPTWLYGAINPDRTHTTSFAIWTHREDNSWNIWRAFRTWCGSSGVKLSLDYSVSSSSLQEIHKNPRDEPEIPNVQLRDTWGHTWL